MVELSDDTPTVTASYPHDYPDSCAMLVDVRDDRIVNVRGNRAYTFTLSVFEVLAAISKDTRLGVVAAPMGYWLGGSRSENTVNSARYADMGRAPTFSDTLIEETPIN